ncbi:hypothetical protein N9W40_03440, partial [Flavobacteriales bacterium]|nr:hypothetical protein [Flavobacteriales bacterium]
MKRFIIICLLSPALLIAQNNFPKLGDEYEGGKVFSICGQEIFIADLSQKDKLTYAKANNKFNKPNSYNDWHLPKASQLSKIQGVLNLHLWDKKIWSSDSIQNNSSLRRIIDFETGHSEWITKSSSAKAYFIPIRRIIYGDKKGLTINEKVRLYVESEIIKWQQKGEFEKTTDYLVRIESRDNKIEELEKLAIDSLKESYAESIRFDDIYMNKYDADNEVFLFHSPQLGEIPLHVPLIHAKEFKDLQNKDKLRYNNPQFVQFDGKFILSH